jgi:HEPN domain-containing protein
MATNQDQIASEWYRRGDSDLGNAEILLEHGGTDEAVCFLAQQAAEKYLKGFIVLNKKKYRLTHDLFLAIKDCAEIDKEFMALDGEAKNLTSYYIESRYPTAIEEYTKKDSKEAVKAAKKIINYVKDKTQKQETDKNKQQKIKK